MAILCPIFNPQRMIYVAAPFSTGNLDLFQSWIGLTQTAVSKLMAHNPTCYFLAPTIQGAVCEKYFYYFAHNIKKDNAAITAQIYEQCLIALRKCDELLVLTLQDWDKSKGIALEINEAERLNTPVTYWDGRNL